MTFRYFSRVACAWSFAILMFATSVDSQTTAFNYQGELTDGGSPANGSFQMQFKLFDALSGGGQIGSTLTNVPVTITSGDFSTKLDFGAVALTGANRWLEIAVRRNAAESYVTLSPREQIASSPYAVRTLSAAMADDSQKLGGVAAADYITTTNGGTSFIRNQSVLQASSAFNISGNGIVGGNLGLGTNATAAKFSILTPTASAGNNTAQFEAPAIGPNGSHIHYGTTGDWYIRSANAGGKVVLQDSGGNVGIGTASPTSKLTVSGIQYGISHIDGSVNLSTFINASGGWFGTRSNHPLHFYTNDSAEQMTLNQAGQLGVGTTAPLAGYRGDFAGPVRSFGNTSHFVVQTTGGTNSWARLYMRSNNRSWFMGTSQNFNGDQFYLADETGNATRMSIQPNGPFFFLGDMTQNESARGLPKAMLFVLANGTISRCYNGINGSSSSGCGFTVSHPAAHVYEINFGFNVSTRFAALTSYAVATGWPNPGYEPIVGRTVQGSNGNSLGVVFWRSDSVGGLPSDFFLILY